MGMLPETYRGAGVFAEIAEFMNRIDRMLNNVRVFGAGRADVSPDHFYIYMDAGRYPRLFDLNVVTATTVKVRGHLSGEGGSEDKVVCIAGVWKQVTGGSVELDAAITMSATVIYIYINVKRSDNTTTLETDSALNDGDDDEERFYLWYVPWDVTNSRINRAGILDMRDSPHWVAGA